MLKKDEEVNEAGGKTLHEQFELCGKMDNNQKCDTIKHFKVARTFIASKTKRTFAFSNTTFAQQIRASVVKRLMQKDWDLKAGRAPASHIERQMQDVLEQMAPPSTAAASSDHR